MGPARNVSQPILQPSDGIERRWQNNQPPLCYQRPPHLPITCRLRALYSRSKLAYNSIFERIAGTSKTFCLSWHTNAPGWNFRLTGPFLPGGRSLQRLLIPNNTLSFAPSRGILPWAPTLAAAHSQCLQRQHRPVYIGFCLRCALPAASRCRDVNGDGVQISSPPRTRRRRTFASSIAAPHTGPARLASILSEVSRGGVYVAPNVVNGDGLRITARDAGGAPTSLSSKRPGGRRTVQLMAFSSHLRAVSASQRATSTTARPT